MGRPVCFCLDLFHLVDFDFCGEKLKIKLYFNCSCNLTGFCSQTFCSCLEIHRFCQPLSSTPGRWKRARPLFPVLTCQDYRYSPRACCLFGLVSSFINSLRENRADVGLIPVWPLVAEELRRWLRGRSQRVDKMLGQD